MFVSRAAPSFTLHQDSTREADEIMQCCILRFHSDSRLILAASSLRHGLTNDHLERKRFPGQYALVIDSQQDLHQTYENNNVAEQRASRSRHDLVTDAGTM